MLLLWRRMPTAEPGGPDSRQKYCTMFAEVAPKIKEVNEEYEGELSVSGNNALLDRVGPETEAVFDALPAAADLSKLRHLLIVLKNSPDDKNQRQNN